MEYISAGAGIKYKPSFNMAVFNMVEIAFDFIRSRKRERSKLNNSWV